MKNHEHPFLTYAHSINATTAQSCIQNTLDLMVNGREALLDGLILDNDGEDFYQLPEHDGIDFTTLEGFMNYAYLLGKQDGKHEVQRDIKQALDL